MRTLLIVPLLALLLNACNKEPGEGGTSKITGKLYRIETNALGQVLAEFYSADEDVYIMYGEDDQIYDDKFATSHDGSFEFTNLVQGSYTVFAYTKCVTCPSQEDTIVSHTVEITEKKQVINIGDVVIYK